MMYCLKHLHANFGHTSIIRTSISIYTIIINVIYHFYILKIYKLLYLNSLSSLEILILLNLLRLIFNLM